jgi:murein DD-endopeptidase MepM/ murein hydrolase activator NlpD
LAGEGVAAVTLELTDHEDPEFDRNLAGLQEVLASVDEILSAEATPVGAEQTWLEEHNTGLWRYPTGSFIHPLALEVLGSTAYLLDGGRVLALELALPTEPELILAPGDAVENVPVLEPLDLANDGTSLLALDRAGDVYRYAPTSGDWTVERYDRPTGSFYDHYFVSLAADGDASYLLETSHEQVVRFGPEQEGEAIIQLPLSRDVDLSAFGNSVYVLSRDLNSPLGKLERFVDGRRDSSFQSNVAIMHPRQVLATETAVFVLDREGRRLLALDPESAALATIHQFADRRDVGTMWADSTGKRLLLAGQASGQGALYFPGEPGQVAAIEGGPVLEGAQPHELSRLDNLRGLQVPIQDARVTTRDFQMPGAPRHYRLGVHEGLDFYTHTTGVPIDSSTEVRSIADGIVIRALVDHKPLTAAESDAWVAKSQGLGYTPPEVLDGYRGMQVWIDHGDGVVSRYAHLSSIAPDVNEGATVRKGQVIGNVGNSGTPGSVGSQTYDVHLHLEIWVNGHYVGQFLRPVETREWLERMLR